MTYNDVELPAAGHVAAAVRDHGGPLPGPASAPRPHWAVRWMPAFPALITLAAVLWKISVPSFWRDEAATLSAVHRPLPALLRMLGNVDAVHGAYYLLMWVLVRLDGSGALAMRLPSALAMAAAAGLTAALGRRLVSTRAGLAAGLAFAAVPAVSWFGQDARPFALETAAAAAASYLLARLLAARDGRRRWACWYAASLVAVGLANVFGLLLIAAHGLTVLALRRDPAVRQAARAWLAAAVAACVIFLPPAVLDWSQRGQVGWLHRPGLSALDTATRLAGPDGVCLAVAVIAAAGVAISAAGGRPRLRVNWPGRLLALALPWLAAPTAILFALSQADPVYTFRYIVFCAPAVSLLVGTALAALGRIAGLVALAVIVALGVPAQLGERRPAGHADNIRGIDRVLATWEMPGDAVLYPEGAGMRTFAAAYPYGLAKLRDVMLAGSPVSSGTISGTDVPLPVLLRRLRGVSRLWVAEANVSSPLPPPVLAGLPFQQIQTWQISDIWLALYIRVAPGAGQSPGQG